MEPTVLLETTGLTKRFGGLVAVNSIDFHVTRGEILGIIGPNGAGKTTLINCLSGALRPDAGKVLFNNKDTTGFAMETMCHLGLSRTFQISQPFPGMSAIENIMISTIFGRNQTTRKDGFSQALDLLNYVDLEIDPNTIAKTLNTVQLKRLDLARALGSNPQLLLLDEPAAGLTPPEQESFMGLIKKIQQRGITIILVEHIMRVVMGLCDRVVVINYGSKISEGSPEYVSADKVVVEAYLGKGYQ